MHLLCRQLLYTNRITLNHASSAPAKPCSARMATSTDMLGLKAQPSVVPRKVTLDRPYVMRRPKRSLSGPLRHVHATDAAQTKDLSRAAGVVTSCDNM